MHKDKQQKTVPAAGLRVQFILVSSFMFSVCFLVKKQFLVLFLYNEMHFTL